MENVRSIPLVFKELSEKKTHLEKVKYLKENRNEMIDFLLLLTFSANHKINLPEGDPPYKSPGEADLYNGTLLYANRRTIEMFVNDNASHLNEMKKEQLWIDMLENLSPLEAILINEIKDKELKSYPGIKLKVVQKVYPNWTYLED
jgi:hypothetical protein